MTVASWSEKFDRDRALTSVEPGVSAPAELASYVEPIDWLQFWSAEAVEQDWLIEPIIPKGRQVAIYSRAKAGKSLLTLDAVAALATGRPILGRRSKPAAHVVYVDLEMGPEDLRERLEDLGYGPDADLSHLHYFQLTALPPLDTELGGRVLEAIARDRNAELVVVDTMARAVNGEENLSDTYRDFYRFTGRRLKAAGIALCRLDHSGKDPTLGQRGSSGKEDDVDVVFRLVNVDDGLVLTRTHTRVPWVPAEVNIRRVTEPVLHHTLADALWPDGTKEVADLLDRHKVPVDARAADASRILKDGGDGRRKQVVLAAIRWRKERA